MKECCKQHKCDSVPHYEELCIQKLKASGARITQPRLAVIRCLAHSKDPLTPREILEEMAKDKDLAKIDQVSVYRIIEALQALGLVHQIFPSGGFVACSHLECSLDLHLLTRCVACGTTAELDVPDAVLAPMRWYLTEELGFAIKEHFIQIDGTCAKCLANPAA